MRNCWLVGFLFGSFLLGILAWGQSRPAAPPQAKTPAAAADDDDDRPVPPPPSAAAVASDAAVLTIKGLCPEDASKAGQSSPAGCQTVITRAEFEKIASAIQPSLSPRVKRQLVSLYPRLLIMSHEAELRGLDKEEYIQQMFAFARMQILTQQLTRRVQAEAAKVPQQDIEDYYQKNLQNFTQYSLERIYIPRLKQEPPPSQKLSEEAEKDRQQNAEAEMTKLAETMRARAASGEAFVALQKEAYQSAGVKSNPPNASMGKIRRTGLPPGHEAVFSLKAGEVSQVLSDAGGHYIYKLESTSMETLADAKDEIHNMLQTQRTKEFMDKIQGPFSTEVNDAYFGTGPAGAASGAANPSVQK
ncbi:MAG: peptidylprolyl isomerase [Candidatus Sulfotelmatobacter sp.]